MIDKNTVRRFLILFAVFGSFILHISAVEQKDEHAWKAFQTSEVSQIFFSSYNLPVQPHFHENPSRNAN